MPPAGHEPKRKGQIAERGVFGQISDQDVLDVAMVLVGMARSKRYSSGSLATQCCSGVVGVAKSTKV